MKWSKLNLYIKLDNLEKDKFGTIIDYLKCISKFTVICLSGVFHDKLEYISDMRGRTTMS